MLCRNRITLFFFCFQADGEWAPVHPTSELPARGRTSEGALQTLRPPQTGEEAAEDVQTRPGRGRDAHGGHQPQCTRVSVPVPLREVELHLRGALPSKYLKKRCVHSCWFVIGWELYNMFWLSENQNKIPLHHYQQVVIVGNVEKR